MSNGKGPVLQPVDPDYSYAMGTVCTNLLTMREVGFQAKIMTFYDWKMINIRYNCNGL